MKIRKLLAATFTMDYSYYIHRIYTDVYTGTALYTGIDYTVHLFSGFLDIKIYSIERDISDSSTFLGNI